MNRRNFLKLGALTGGSLLTADWLFNTELAQASPSEVVSESGVLKMTLTADERMIKYGNSTRWAMTYNGTFPAPTMRVKPGDTLQITLVNKLSNPTNLHTHGLHVSPSGNADNPLLMIEPGKTFNYVIKIPKNQKSGTFWYHPHHHELSAGQVSAGLAGAIIVEDSLDSLPIFKNTNERTIVLSDPAIGKTSAVIATSQMDLMHGRSGPNTLVNGELAPTFKVSGSKAERLRIVNSCVSTYQTIFVDGAQMWQVSADSSRLTKPYKVSSITLTPGQRTEVVIVAPKAFTYKLQTDIQTLAKFTTRSASQAISANPILPFNPITKVDRTRTLNIKGMGMGMMGGASHEASFTFDGKVFDPNRVDQQVKFGSTEEWIINNPTGIHHPFHIHVWPFQIVDDGYGKSHEGWHDTISLPSGSTVRIRIPFVDIAGTTVYHCHILDHEDAGMMGIVKVS
jgi:FtsP/CotA-like multicopper oxidase with cupredoxin domain